MGASGASVLVSELPDPLSRAYLRRPHFVSRAQSGKSLLPQKAEKDSHECDCLFLAEQERFELSRRYSRPTPLAGAPLHHLSTTPNQLYKIVHKPGLALVCHSIISSFLRFVKVFYCVFQGFLNFIFAYLFCTAFLPCLYSLQSRA